MLTKGAGSAFKWWDDDTLVVVAQRQLSRNLADASCYIFGDITAAHNDAVGCSVAAAIVLHEVFATKGVVLLLGVGYAIRVLFAKHRLSKNLACDGLHLATLNGELLATFLTIGGNLLFGESGVEQHLFDDLRRGLEKLAQRAEGDIGVVAVDVDIEIGAIVV